MPEHQPRIPASPAIVKRIIPEILESDGALKRSAIIGRLRQLLPGRGFSYNANSVAATKKALSQLVDEGKISSRRNGWYEPARSSTVGAIQDAGPHEDVSLSNQGSAMEPNTPRLKIMRETGKGPECVYVYYFDIYLEQAQSKGNSTWACKVGWTVGDPDERIIGQGALTCFPNCPVIGLVIRTHDGKSLENLLHSALSYAGCRINGNAGREWFLTSPERIEKWFLQFKETVNILTVEVPRS